MMKNSEYDRDENYTTNGREAGGFLTGLLMGGLIGATAGLLLAPKTGQELRAQIRNKSVEVRDQVTQTAEDARQRTEMLVEDTKTKAESLVEKTKSQAEDLQRRSKELVKTGKGRVEKTAEAALQAAQETWEETGKNGEPATTKTRSY